MYGTKLPSHCAVLYFFVVNVIILFIKYSHMLYTQMYLGGVRRDLNRGLNILKSILLYDIWSVAYLGEQEVYCFSPQVLA